MCQFKGRNLMRRVDHIILLQDRDRQRLVWPTAWILAVVIWNYPHATHAMEPRSLPITWNTRTDENIKWSAKIYSPVWPVGLGQRPCVAEEKVYVGSNSRPGYVPRHANPDYACLLCFDAAKGSFLWQYSSPRLESGSTHDYGVNAIAGLPHVEGDRLWVVTNRCELVCLDTEGFQDGENDGPYREETSQNSQEADVVWKLDMMDELGVEPHNICRSAIAAAGDLIFLNTGNGVAGDHSTVRSPLSPSFLAVHKSRGTVVWSDSSPGKNLLHGGWSSPVYGVLGGEPQVIFGGGDGWLYSFDPAGAPGGESKLLWRFDCNPKQSKWDVRPGLHGTRNNLIAAPVIHRGLVIIGVGQDPEHGDGNGGHLWCIDPTRRGDVSPELVFNQANQHESIPAKKLQACDPEAGDFTRPNSNSAVVWHYGGVDLDQDGKLAFEETLHRVVAEPAIRDDLLYIPDVGGIVHCINVETGAGHWTHDLSSWAFATPIIDDNHVFVFDQDGQVTVFHHSDRKAVLSCFWANDTIEVSPLAQDGVLYLVTRNKLLAIEAEQP